MILSRRGLLLLLLLLVVGSIAAGAWIAYTGLQARTHLNAARAALPELRAALVAGDQAAATAELDSVRGEVEAAYDRTHDPVWTVAAQVPMLGQPIATTRGLTAAVHELNTETLPDLLSVAAQLKPSRLVRPGEVDVVALDRAIGPLTKASKGLEEQRGNVEALSPSWVSSIAQARSQLLEELGELTTSTRRFTLAARTVPPMLGLNEPRRYFMAFQNPAEARGTGGLLGAFAIVKADLGKISVERTGSNSGLPRPKRLLEGLDPSLVSDDQDEDHTNLWVNSNTSPDFPRVATDWGLMWRSATGQKVDGAIALDAAALSAIMEATGPIDAPGVGQVSAATVEKLVLMDQYELAADRLQRHDVMIRVGRAVIARLLSGRGQPRVLFQEVGQAARDGHVLISSRHTAEQSAFTKAGLSGTLSDAPGPFAQAVIVNATGSKLDAYLDLSLDYTVKTCTPRKRSTDIAVTLHNDAPRRGLPHYVVRRGDDPPYPTQRGQSRMQVQLLLGRGAVMTGAELDGRRLVLAPPLGQLPRRLDLGTADAFVEETQVRGHPAYSAMVELKPGETRTMLVHVEEPVSARKPLLPVQPLARTPEATADVSACGRSLKAALND